MKRTINVSLALAFLSLVVASCGAAEYEPTVTQQQAVIDDMTRWYVSTGAFVPSDVEILASADQTCDDFHEFGSLKWRTLDTAVAGPADIDNLWAYDTQFEAISISETGYCTQATDTYEDYYVND